MSPSNGFCCQTPSPSLYQRKNMVNLTCKPYRVPWVSLTAIPDDALVLSIDKKKNGVSVGVSAHTYTILSEFLTTKAALTD
jgi:hypothetical protein